MAAPLKNVNFRIVHSSENRPTESLEVFVQLGTNNVPNNSTINSPAESRVVRRSPFTRGHSRIGTRPSRAVTSLPLSRFGRSAPFDSFGHPIQRTEASAEFSTSTPKSFNLQTAHERTPNQTKKPIAKAVRSEHTIPTLSPIRKTGPKPRSSGSILMNSTQSEFELLTSRALGSTYDENEVSLKMPDESPSIRTGRSLSPNEGRIACYRAASPTLLSATSTSSDLKTVPTGPAMIYSDRSIRNVCCTTSATKIPTEERQMHQIESPFVIHAMVDGFLLVCHLTQRVLDPNPNAQIKTVSVSVDGQKLFG
ncbi:hypothetical protein M3Y98_00707900 [Aphelenchoides besseyi]|nr:hypothetical protein M3Y98_00707900 [Aphelenchoides besseyi]KAI6210360.1 hypothetical protein M3Y96_00320000 [Aphelenchoides besseyi]